MAARLKEMYDEDVVPRLREQFDYDSVMEVPRIEKIVVNMGVGEAREEPELLEGAMRDLAMITGQRPRVTRAKRAVANFQIREGIPIGCKVTLRGERMYDFLDRLINLALPQVRDFRGISPDSFDGRGNYSLGLDEQVVFPEVSYQEVENAQGMDVTIVTSAENDEQAFVLLSLLGMPFKREE